MKVLENSVSTPAGLAEWFADDVNIKEDIYTFIWDKSEQKARLKSKKSGAYVRFKWLEDEEEGNGFGFENFDAADLLHSLHEAIEVYNNKPAWKKLVRRALQEDFSWQQSAYKYIALYKKLKGEQS